MTPKVSVILPVYNAAAYLEEAITSIRRQTFTDWELIIVDDGSTDNSAAIALQQQSEDQRITIIKNTSIVRGAGNARNIGIQAARGNYVAMMDADDISIENRLDKQVAFMESHPDIVLSLCNMQSFGGSNQTIAAVFTSYYMIRALLLFNLRYAYNGLIFDRARVFERYGEMPYAEDLVFFSSVAMRCKVGVLPETLYMYRVHADSLSAHADKLAGHKAAFSQLLPLRFGFTPTDEELITHAGLFHPRQIYLSFLRKNRWRLRVLTRAALPWHERAALFFWMIGRGLAKTFIWILER